MNNLGKSFDHLTMCLRKPKVKLEVLNTFPLKFLKNYTENMDGEAKFQSSYI
jgi:hypothetical protein